MINYFKKEKIENDITFYELTNNKCNYLYKYIFYNIHIILKEVEFSS